MALSVFLESEDGFEGKQGNKTSVHVAPSYTMASDYRVPTKMASTSPGRSEGFSNANGTGESYSGVTGV